MSDAKKARFSEAGYSGLIDLCALIIMTVVVKGLANLYLLVSVERCDTEPYWSDAYGTPPDIVCTTSGLYWNRIGAIGVLIVSVVLMFWLINRRYYWYREVVTGKVTGHDWYSQPGIYTSGFQQYRVGVEGKTRQGETRVDWHSVQPKTYYDTKVGDPIDFS